MGLLLLKGLLLHFLRLGGLVMLMLLADDIVHVEIASVLHTSIGQMWLIGARSIDRYFFGVIDIFMMG